ncbi:MAG: DUF2169 domain-containing protein [Deltaproteobacteria bacterium]|nr:DUF2169 domain-containing protein [Deltaproteobacteria bacterium]
MRVIKPLSLGLLTRCFEHERQSYLVVSPIVHFGFGSSRPLPEVELWKLVGAELGEGVLLDEAMWKARGELLVTGRAYVPGGAPRPACSVRVALGSIDKTLWVVGDRSWKHGAATEPEPFAQMPIDWAHAFGGAGYGPNPLGKGLAPVVVDGRSVHPLPNVEDPARLVRTPTDRPEPAGLGPYDLTWPQRFSKVGTYDSRWFKERFPGLAEDLDWAFFQTAPIDQQIEGYFTGDEPFVVEGMHASKSRLEGRLPGLRARAWLRLRAGGPLVELDTRLDTVRLLPHVERGVLVFRGVAKVAEDDAADVSELMLACERLGAPRPAEHYERVLAQRLDKEKGYLYALRDSDLTPAPDQGEPAPFPDPAGAVGLLAGDAPILRQRLRRRAEIEREKMREEARAAGVDPDGLDYLKPLPPDEPVPAIEELPQVVERALAVVEEQKQQAEQKKAELGQELRRTCQEAGLDYEAVMRDAEQQRGGPPRFSADEELAKLRELRAELVRAGGSTAELDALCADPELEPRLRRAEDQMREAYRLSAHYADPAPRPGAERAAALREALDRARRAGSSHARVDLTGVDLSGLDLHGADLREAFLERANLAGADLRAADLTSAVLARADLTGARLDGAKLAGANLGRAVLRQASLGQADLAGTILAGADLSQASLRGARLVQADLTDAVVAGADFGELRAESLFLVRVDLSGTLWTRAQATQCAFVEVDLAGADFSGARLEKSAFVSCRGAQARFADASLENLRIVHGSRFPGASFVKASLRGANLRGTDLGGADFTQADLDRADLSECKLEEARFYRATARGAMFAKADLSRADLTSVNLMDGILQKARIRGTIFRGANLFRVDFAKVDGDAGTVFDDANMKLIRFVERRSDATR